MKLPLSEPPASICIMRLSAVGDICHILPVVRTMQRAWPKTRITWVIGKLEHSLVGDIDDIEFIIFDKSRGLSAFRDLWKTMRGRKFDVLLHMQMSLRASLATILIPARIRLGFHRSYAKDLQWLFTNAKVKQQDGQHVVDSFFNFIETLGINWHELSWDIPIPVAADEFAARVIPNETRTLIISPCSSMSYRNWTTDGYAEMADYAAEKYGMRVILTGGKSEIERSFGDVIVATASCKPVNLIGRTDLKQLLALLHRATVLLAPDSGPAHIATAVGTPVIGLYACTNPDRARPYLSTNYVVNRYDEAVLEKYGKLPKDLPWGIRVRDEGNMERILASDVERMFDKLMTSHHQ